MKQLQTHCETHPDRLAVGVCVVTKQPICAECSTQHKGVNYSKDGLRSMLAEQASKPTRGARTSVLLLTISLLALPLSFLVVFLVLYATGAEITDMLEWIREESEW